MTRRNGSSRAEGPWRQPYKPVAPMPPAPPEEGLCIAGVRGEIGFLKGGINLRDSIGESLKEELLSLKLCIV